MMPIGRAMTKAGKAYPFTEWAYHVRCQGEDLYFGIVRRGLRWRAELIKTQNMPDSVSVAIESCETIHQLPYNIEVSVRLHGTSETILLGPEDRVVKASLQEPTTVSFLPESGYYPAFYVGLVGAVASGKSCLICAAQTKKTERDIQHLLPNGYLSAHTETLQSKLPPTELGRISQYPLYLLDHNGQIRSVVYLMDVSGEVCLNCGMRWELDAMAAEKDYQGSKTDAQAASRVLRTISKIWDGLIFVVDERTFDPQAQIRGDVETVYHVLQRQRCLPKVRCLVCTHSMKIEEVLQKTPEKLKMSRQLAPNSVVFQDIIAADDPREAMNQHMAVAGQILGPVLGISNQMACFFVDSVEENDALDPETGHHRKTLDFSQSSNVSLPVAYMIENLVRT